MRGIGEIIHTRVMNLFMTMQQDIHPKVKIAAAVNRVTVYVETNENNKQSLLYAMKEMVAKLNHIISEVRSSSDALSSASEEVSATSQSLNQTASRQSASVEETSPPRWSKFLRQLPKYGKL